VSPTAKRWLLHLLRIAVTAVAVVVVIRMIRWQDYWMVVDTLDGKAVYHDLDKIRSVSYLSRTYTVTWADGTVTSAVQAAKREGFLSLFDHTNKPLFFAMAAAMMVPFFLVSLRWWMLLRGHGFQPRMGQIFFITYAGAFFNNFLPGSVGGDLTKAILASSGEERKAAVAGTVILDRVIGLCVMIALGAASLTPNVGRFWIAGDRRLVYLIYGLFGAMVVGYLLYFSPPIRRLVGRLPFKKTVAELDGVFRAANEKKALVARAAGLSLVAQVSGILAIYGLAMAMGIGPGLWMFFVFEPIIFIVTAVPISVGGWGVQEYIYEKLFSDFGGMDPNHAIGLSVLYKLSLILVSIPGGLLFAMGATKRAPEAPAGD
jgi:glycosyltransferase 2 family protein